MVDRPSEGTDERRAPATTPAPPRCESDTPSTDTTDYRTETTKTFPRERCVYRAQWRGDGWARSTPTKSRLFADSRPAMALLDRLKAKGYRVALSWARCGVFHAVDFEVPTVPVVRPGECRACGGTGWFLPEVEALRRPCPPCRRVSS